MQYIITAYDYVDEEAINRRLAAREQHLAGIRALIKNGNFISGGAILDGSGKMIGSSVHVEFTTRSALDYWLMKDPYVTNKVWESIEVTQALLVPVEQYQ
ncbi:hypothetical protein PSECIP111951_03629 [Pseudoalteromonas holothuriae]|uniref:YCII-related domain-containing protein n=1 Tax=Pseudoalteromonas holothuriae TaxID=2963714 RepID=A0A9W4R3Z1_9GAMM|nr:MULTISPECIES: YciI family protein [unclassified Pseudoalteromonas]CAH9065060.1 hypothetical protein PSECIP111854_03598 [Pseudoalteromonas sp. CIP111854]CAH9066708.1 hypothetical protein PSECIP111951_03629 [Pseudoalteromonas sp. CIP111951]